MHGNKCCYPINHFSGPSGITEILKMKHTMYQLEGRVNNVTRRLHHGKYGFQILLSKVGVQENKGNENEEIETMPFKISAMRNQTYKVCHQR